MSLKIGIVDNGMGNLSSVDNAFRTLGLSTRFIHSPEEINSVQAIVLPGVGAFCDAMERLRKTGLDLALTDAVMKRSVPFLGICLGMQLIANYSEEGGHETGLGWIDSVVSRIVSSPNVRVPHVGWNDISFNKNSEIFQGINTGTHFYFDHSYEMLCNPKLVVAQTVYGDLKIIAGIQMKNIIAVQFHPEKSQLSGLRLISNFVRFSQTKIAYRSC